MSPKRAAETLVFLGEWGLTSALTYQREQHRKLEGARFRFVGNQVVFEVNGQVFRATVEEVEPGRSGEAVPLPGEVEAHNAVISAGLRRVEALVADVREEIHPAPLGGAPLVPLEPLGQVEPAELPDGSAGGRP